MNARRPSAPRCRHSTVVQELEAAPDLCSLWDATAKAGPRFYWHCPERDEALLAVGAAHTVRCDGPDRLAVAGREVLAVLEGVDCAEGASARDLLRFVGGFAFSSALPRAAMWRGFGSCWFFLPAALWVVRGGRAWHLQTTACEHRDPAGPAGGVGASELVWRETHNGGGAEGWARRVDSVLELVRRGEVTKIVLSRSDSASLDRTPELGSALAELTRTRPSCFTFCLSSGDAHFVGSTPELLVKLEGERLETQALAGTAPRGEDRTGDDRNADALLASDKDRREHASVRSGIEDALSPVARSLDVGEVPEVVRLPEALHLYTPVGARVAPGADALALADRLHPTPAVCGSPRAEAYAYLAREEAGRGWYSGGVGWMGRGGDGTFAVALRSALLHGGNTVTAWGGAGIVEGSRADAELAETDLKMRVVREALAGKAGAEGRR